MLSLLTLIIRTTAAIVRIVNGNTNGCIILPIDALYKKAMTQLNINSIVTRIYFIFMKYIISIELSKIEIIRAIINIAVIIYSTYTDSSEYLWR